MKANGPAAVARQYTREENLEARRSIYDAQEVPDPREVLFEARIRRSSSIFVAEKAA